jgi:hypothetical protein
LQTWEGTIILPAHGDVSTSNCQSIPIKSKINEIQVYYSEKKLLSSADTYQVVFTF